MALPSGVEMRGFEEFLPSTLSVEALDAQLMHEVYKAALQSNDRSTQVGAVANIGGHIIGRDCNRPPIGWDDEDMRVHTKPTKDWLCAHAEENLIANAAANGVRLKGARVTTNFCPCARCAVRIFEAGIVEVVAHKEFPGNDGLSESFAESHKMAQEIFAKKGITFRWWSGITPIRHIRYDGSIHFLREPGAPPWRGSASQKHSMALIGQS